MKLQLRKGNNTLFKIELSIIIVHYKTYDLTKQTIDSVHRESSGFSYEILLVDNHSDDGSIERLARDYADEVAKERLHIIENKANLGFAKANNIGIRQAQGEYILLLNSDTEISDNAIGKSLIPFRKEERLGALGCRVLLPDGTLDHACKRGFPTPAASLFYFAKLHRLFPKSSVFAAYTAGHLSEYETAEVDCITGAYMLLRREALAEVDNLCEAYFMYGEDIELCYRLRRSGWKILYFSEASILHHKGGSGKAGNQVKNPKVLYEFYHAMKIFYDRNLKDDYPAAVRYGIRAAVDIAYYLAKRKNEKNIRRLR